MEAGTGPILTGEAPTIDSGGLDALEERIAEMARWVDAMNATDNPAARAHASNVSVAIGLVRLGVEPVLQVVCRDKNRIACQADIVGAALHGIENVCCLTGDDVTAGDEPEARRVFDLDGPQLVSVASTLARGQYLSGRAIDPPPSLFVGAVENAGAPPLAHRAARAAKKIAAGARFLQLQICYFPARLEAFVAALHDTGMTEHAAILPTVVLVRGARSLAFMHREVPGIDVPAETMARVEDAADQAEEAYLLAFEQARHALSLPGVRGLHLTDFRHDGSLSRLCTDLGLHSSKETKEEERMHTVLSSRSNQIVIGADRPFCIIGERINPTGRKAFAEALRAGDLSGVVVDVEDQVAMGAHVLDVNMGVPLTDEADLLARAVRLVQEHTDLPICIDSSVVEALEAGLAAYEGKALVNSVTCEEERLARVLPMVKEHGAAIICLVNDETGIPQTADERLEVCARLVDIVHGRYEIPFEDIVIDPLAMTVGADPQAVVTTLETITRIRDSYGLNMTLGASNTSFGLPGRHALNAAFLAIASYAGLTSAIMDARTAQTVDACRAADLLLGRDEWGTAWIAAHRKAQAATA